jgi:hypothetical protein
MHKEIAIHYVPTSDNLADMPTKPLAADVFHHACMAIGLLSGMGKRDPKKSRFS